MKEVMEQTKLDRPICDHVWQLVNPRGLDRFDKTMFSMAMHFLYNKKKLGSIDLPPQIPEETLMSIDPEGYFKMKQQLMNMRNQPPPSQIPHP
jgi:hypothetical protein